MDAMKVKLFRDLTVAVTKPTTLVLFAVPQKAVNRSGYISESKYGVPRTTCKNKKKN